MVFSERGEPLPPSVAAWAADEGLSLLRVRSGDELLAVALRSRPRLVILDARKDAADTGAPWLACQRLKRDSYTGIVPAVALVGDSEEAFEAAIVHGADEVLRHGLSDREVRQRLMLLLRRSDRDVYVHPSTRLPGTVEIEAEIARRMAAGEGFAVCYADLDHFKEFNDRYSYFEGDRVIRLLARLLHDVVKGSCGERGFVGHIGGDDFIFIIPHLALNEICTEIVTVFDLLVPYQYSEHDRRAGYFFGKDRRGQLHRVPLMTLSIGVVTNERRHFVSAAQVSELATEMKGYAKTLAGSVYTVDRRTDHPSTGGEPTPPRPPRVISVIDES
jgi:diguanylate cyclase (GGDEF)-like protein